MLALYQRIPSGEPHGGNSTVLEGIDHASSEDVGGDGPSGSAPVPVNAATAHARAIAIVKARLESGVPLEQLSRSLKGHLGIDAILDAMAVVVDEMGADDGAGADGGADDGAGADGGADDGAGADGGKRRCAFDAETSAPKRALCAPRAPARIELQASIFRGMHGCAGDFIWEVQQALRWPAEHGHRTLWIFNDNEQDRLTSRAGGGNAAIRPYNDYGKHKIAPCAAGITTGSHGAGYRKLARHVQKIIDEDFVRMERLLATGAYATVVYSSDGHGGLGCGIFARTLGDDVKKYILDGLKRVVQRASSGAPARPPAEAQPMQQFGALTVQLVRSALESLFAQAADEHCSRRQLLCACVRMGGAAYNTEQLEEVLMQLESAGEVRNRRTGEGEWIVELV